MSFPDVTQGRRGAWALGAAAVAASLGAWIAARPVPPAERVTARAEPSSAPVTERHSGLNTGPVIRIVTGTITRTWESLSCGTFIGATTIRYDRFGVIVPCIEFLRHAGLRFAVGDTHRVIVDGSRRVLAIEWNGRRFPVTGYPVVVMPAAATGPVETTYTIPDGQLHYSAGTWRWDPPCVRGC